MGLNVICPNCGFESTEVRCPRCNTLKVVGCTGACMFCSNRPDCQKRIPTAPAPRQRSAETEHPAAPGSAAGSSDA